MHEKTKQITIYDIAAKLDISTATVSRALSGTAGVNKKTKKKIEETAQEMGYSFNPFASNLRTKRSKTIGVIVPKLNSSFMADVIAGIETVVNDAGYSLIISQSLETMVKEIKNAQMMFNTRVDGVLVSLAYDTSNIDHFQNFIKRNVPIIFFDRVYEDKDCPNIHINNFKAGYQITDHLAKQGCKKIAHVTAVGIRNVYEERFNGYLQALKDNDLIFADDLLFINDLSAEAGTDLAKIIAKKKNMPDGIFFANDACAINCMIELKDLGIKIPHDIAIAGFNNDRACLTVDPKLTSINYKGHEIGEVAAKLLIDHLTSDHSKQLTHSIVFRHELIVRASSLRTSS